MAASSSMALSVDDILSDLEKLQQSQPPSSDSSRHQLLSLGHSLLSPSLQSGNLEKGIQPPSSANNSTPSINDLTSAIARLDQEESQIAALSLSSIYLDGARSLLELNQDQDSQTHLDSNTSRQQQQSVGLFDDLHRRVATLQSSNEGYMNKLQEVRSVVAGSGSLQTLQ